MPIPVQPAHHQSGVFHFSYAHDRIETLFNHVGQSIGELRIKLNLGISLLAANQVGHEPSICRSAHFGALLHRGDKRTTSVGGQHPGIGIFLKSNRANPHGSTRRVEVSRHRCRANHLVAIKLLD